MTTQLPSKGRLEKIASWRETYGAGHNVMLPAEEAEALAHFALAAHEQEPVYLIGPIEDEPGRNRRLWLEVPATNWMAKAFYTHPAPVPAVPDEVMPGGLVYSSALPKFESNDSDKVVGYFCFISGDTRIVESQEQAYADAKAVVNACRAAMLNGGKSERDKVRAAHAEWSQKTFGNVGPVGPLKHLAKEAIEAADAPDDLSEWADMQFLLWDAQRRAGITDEQINHAMLEKLAVNKAREWPEPKDGEPRLHIQSAPKV